MKIAGISDIGLVRSSNQDNYLITENLGSNLLAMVCDGIGGANAGDIASLTVVRYVGEAFSNTQKFVDVSSAKLWLEKILHQVNDEVFAKTLSDDNLQGMGTTFVGALFLDDKVLVANVGDSRAYTVYNNKLYQVTTDHSLVNDLVAKGQIDSDEALDHPQRNILTNALGVVSNLKVDIYVLNFEEVHKLLLCSDGLSGYVSAEVIKNIVINDESINQILSNLVKEANNVGGYDNITAIVADLGGTISE